LQELGGTRGGVGGCFHGEDRGILYRRGVKKEKKRGRRGTRTFQVGADLSNAREINRKSGSSVSCSMMYLEKIDSLALLRQPSISPPPNQSFCV